MIERTCLAVILALGTPASSQNVNGNELYTFCQSAEAEFLAFCRGYTVGVNDGLHLGALITLLKSGIEFGSSTEANEQIRKLLGFCVPPDATTQQVQDIVTAWLRDNPTDRHFPARIATFTALSEAFPCDLLE